jgi:hypothetical protein
MLMHAMATAQAASPQVCERYARDAVASQRLNLARRCELKGDPWSLDERNHFQWCLGQGQAALDRENRNRSSHLDTCNRCAEYAHTAVDAQRQNIKRGCGFRGSPWSEDERGHYRWCTRVSQVEAGKHTGLRDEALKRC